MELHPVGFSMTGYSPICSAAAPPYPTFSPMLFAWVNSSR
jgi:hypothetical protein